MAAWRAAFGGQGGIAAPENGEGQRPKDKRQKNFFHLLSPISLCLLIPPKQVAVDMPHVIDGNLCPVRHGYNSFHSVQLFRIVGDRHITASDLFIVRQEVCDGDSRLFLCKDYYDILCELLCWKENRGFAANIFLTN